MKKRPMTLMSIILLNQSIFCCQIILTNTSNTWVSVKDLNEQNTFYQPVGKNIAIKANKNPNQHAMLSIMIGPKLGHPQASYTVEQIACSDSHEIPIASADIEKLDLGTLFIVKKGEGYEK